jgi:hypothetical protein
MRSRKHSPRSETRPPTLGLSATCPLTAEGATKPRPLGTFIELIPVGCPNPQAFEDHYGTKSKASVMGIVPVDVGIGGEQEADEDAWWEYRLWSAFDKVRDVHLVGEGVSSLSIGREVIIVPWTESFVREDNKSSSPCPSKLQ